MTVSEWLRKHRACPEGYAWAVSSCSTMQQVWDTAKPEWLVWVATRPRVLDDITLRRFACWCARQVWHLLTDERSRHAVETAERFCDETATLEELAAAKDAAWLAVIDAASDAACAAARHSAMIAAKYASDASMAAATHAAMAMANAPTADESTAVGAAARVATFTVQAQWLRDNATPNFDY
jgi:Xaa-Pro aminopeptidase